MNLLLAMRRGRPYHCAMILRALCSLAIVAFFAGCPMADQKPNKAKGKVPGKTEKPKVPTRDESGDVAFQAFSGRLRMAVEKRDVPTLSSMMAPDFGYRWDHAPEGETPFDFWDKNNLWGELASVLKERWVPHEGFMVVPPQFALSESYRGYRAGLRMIGGSWKLAYFVPAPPPEP